MSGDNGYSDEARRALEEVGAEPDAPTEIAVPGTLLYVKLLIQCGSCLAVGRETALELEATNSEDLDDLVVACELCSRESLPETGCRTVIPVGVYVGEDSNVVDQALELLEAAATDGTDAGAEEQPFAGVEPGDMPLVPAPPEADDSEDTQS